MRHLLVLCVLFTGLHASAQNSLDLYRAVVPVKSQSEVNRKYAAQKGMQEVLVRMSASEEVLTNEFVKKAIGRAQSFVEQYQFRLVTDEAIKEKGYREEMNLLFSETLIKRLLLNRACTRFWAEGNRPKILLWLVEDDPSYGKQLLNVDSLDAKGEINEVVAGLSAAAKERGMPIGFPLLDLEDQTAITADDVWKLREHLIKDASQRYSAPVVLVGRYSYTSRGELWSTWQYYHQDFQQTWDSRAKETETLAWEALAPLNEFLAQRYAVVPCAAGDAGALVLRLSGINSFRQFRQALDYLNGLAMVEDVSVLEVGDGDMLLALKSEADFERFQDSVQLDKKLDLQIEETDIPQWQQPPQGIFENPAIYKWLGT